MKNFFLAIPLVCLAATLVRPLAAQFEINGPNAAMTIQRQVPSTADPSAHNVVVSVPGTLSIDVDSGVNAFQGIILLASASELTGPQFPTVPWGGSIDIGSSAVGIGSVVILADGIGFTVNPLLDFLFRTDNAATSGPTNNFTLNLTVTELLCGGRAAFQCVVQDPTNGPIFIDNTEAGDANFNSGQVRILQTGGDGAVQVPFLNGHSFSFHGVTYTDVFVNGNGYVNFQSFSSVVAGGFVIDTISFVTSEPAIAACTADWGIDNFGFSDGVFYSESVDPVGGCTILISWGDPRGLPSGTPGMSHFGDIDTGNQIDVLLFGDVDPVLNPCGIPAAGTSGNFTLRWPSLDTTAFTQPGDGAFGHTPGGTAAVGVQASTDLLGQTGTTSTGVAAIEEHDNNRTNGSLLGWDGAGGRRAYNSIFAATGMQVDFLASTAAIPGDLGYVSVPTGLPADDVEEVTGFLATAGGQMTIIGKFFGFGSGTVDITDASGATFTGIAGTVTSGTGPIFVSESLIVNYPPLAVGPVTVTVNFGSGYVEAINARAFSPCQAPQLFTLFDDQSLLVNLTTSVTHYGVTYSQLFLCSNGLISFNGGTFSGFASITDLFSGFDATFGIPFGPSIAPAWGNLNPFGTSGYAVIEDTCTGETSLAFTNQFYANSGTPAGDFFVTLNWGGIPDQVLFDYRAMIDEAVTPGSGTSFVVGYSDGVTGQDTDFSFLGGIAAQIPGYVSTAGPDSFGDTLPSDSIATTLGGISGAIGPGSFAVLNSGTTGLLVIF